MYITTPHTHCGEAGIPPLPCKPWCLSLYLGISWVPESNARASSCNSSWPSSTLSSQKVLLRNCFRPHHQDRSDFLSSFPFESMTTASRRVSSQPPSDRGARHLRRHVRSGRSHGLCRSPGVTTDPKPPVQARPRTAPLSSDFVGGNGKYEDG